VCRKSYGRRTVGYNRQIHPFVTVERGGMSNDHVGMDISYIENMFKLKGNKMLTQEQVARVCHEVNKAYCQSLGDNSQPSWEQAPEWQRKSAINGVAFHVINPDAGADSSHKSWLAEKEKDGWAYGVVKNPDKKQHPCMVPFENLPVSQQAKDYIFRAIVHSILL
jgi:hypothetical protein